MSASSDKVFAGSIPQIYDELLVPLIFQPYALDLANRVAARNPRDVLEIAAGTGVVTRAMSGLLPAGVAIVATDLNPPMIERARAVGTTRPVDWRPADAMNLPFPDASFDVVACQFGAMFFPDRAKAFSEARRVLRPAGAFLFNVWDRIEENEYAEVATAALAEMFPADPPLFMRRTPHGYFDVGRIREDLARGGYPSPPEIVTVKATSRAGSPRDVAVAYCQGTPLRNEIESRDASALPAATSLVEKALALRFGEGAIEGRIQAHVIVAPAS
ncbi:MAG: class I SAM-dependent methyltransferase [Usitatibacter sp.]